MDVYHKYRMDYTFTTWERRRRKLPESERLLPLLRAAGATGMTRQQVGNAVDLDRDDRYPAPGHNQGHFDNPLERARGRECCRRAGRQNQSEDPAASAGAVKVH